MRTSRPVAALVDRVLLAAVLLVAGIAIVVWGAERFTDGGLAIARRAGVSAFWIGAVVSGFEPENLATGIAAGLSDLPQIALGTVIGSSIFMLTAGFGIALLIVPMAVTIPRAGGVAMLIALAAFGVALIDGRVGRFEAGALVVIAIALLFWLYRRSPAFLAGDDDDGDEPRASRVGRQAIALALGLVAMVVGAELVVRGVRGLLATVALSETFLGMTVIGLGESLEETARMVAPARRGHPEMALGNVVGTVVVLLALNLGVIALVRPPVADARVLAFHAPYVAACVAVAAIAFVAARRLGRVFGAALVAAYVVYLAVNVVWFR